MKIGITGGIGSGKSYVCSIIEKLGYPIFYSDKEAKWLMENNLKLKHEITELVGNGAYVEHSLNKNVIRNFIFNSEKNRKKLNDLVHPVVFKHFEIWSKQLKNNELIFNESALLFETGSSKRFDKIILITAPTELKIERLTQRDNLSKQEVVKRIDSQLSDKEKISLADFVIENNEKDLLVPKIVTVLNQLKNGI